MKIQNILMIGLLGMGTLYSCQDDEVLNLENFPVNQPNVFMQDADKLSAKLLATYQGDGSLALNGSLSRTYVYRFKASPEEIKVNFTPVCTNIPSDKVQLSNSSVVLAPGETDAVVTVSLTDDDFSFATPNVKAENYELGVLAAVQGYNVTSEPLEQKIVIEKEAYQVHASFKANSNKVSFTRTLADGGILEKDPMEYSFKIELDKPAQKDVILSVVTEGLDEKFLNTVTVSPAEIVIPAGQKVSQDIKWTVANDFLLEKALPEAYKFILKLNVQSEDETVQTEALNNIEVNVNKRVVNLGMIQSEMENWVEVNKADCSVLQMTNFYGDKSILLDGQFGKDAAKVSTYTWYLPGVLSFDLKSERSLKGIRLNYGSEYNSYTVVRDMTIFTSTDGNTWLEQGELENLSTRASHVLRFYTEIKARYVKIQVSKISSFSTGITEFTAFE